MLPHASGNTGMSVEQRLVHPHLYQACQAAGIREATVDLLENAPYPPGLPRIEPLRLSLTALHNKFLAILAANGFGPSDVAAATLRFQSLCLAPMVMPAK